MNKIDPPHGAVQLNHLGVMTALGADADQFLHNQLTNDIVHLTPQQARLAGYCSAKGRLQANFVVFKLAPNEPVLVCAASVLQTTLKRLSMFVLRSKCKLHDATQEQPLWGLMGEAAQSLSAHLPPWGCQTNLGTTVIRLPDVDQVSRCWVVNPSAQLRETWPSAPLDKWLGLEVMSGIPLIEAATVEQFVPQMLNYELLGGVDFKKGCYPGQEVVARSQYRGVIKRRMYLYGSDEPVAAGQEIFHSDDMAQPAGMVVNAAPHPCLAGWVALVELKLSALSEGSLHLAGPGGCVLHRHDLPYPVTIDSN